MAAQAMKKTAKQRADERRLILYKRFAAIYISNGLNSTRAYMALYPRSSEAAARSSAPAVLAHPSVQDEIARLTAEAWKRERMSSDEVLGRMARLARTNMADFFWKPDELDRNGQPTQAGQRKQLHELTEEQTERIKSIKYDFNGHTIFELWDKPAQLTNVAKHLRLLTDRVDLNIGMKMEDLVGGKDPDAKDSA